ncbi:MAG: AtpZ/AtpI family protein [Gemmatimonadales bacterium]
MHRPPADQGRGDPAAKSYGQGYAYFAMALAFAVAIVAFGAAGWAVDGWLHTRPLFAVLGAFLGGFTGFLRIYYRVKSDTDAARSDRETGSGKRDA